jgi:NADP-dependent 3-hydroxy acid dehydrogenase YdfG
VAITSLRPRAAFPRASFAPSPNLALVDGDIGQAATAERIAQAVIAKFGSAIGNNSGIMPIVPMAALQVEERDRMIDAKWSGDAN